MSESGEIRKGGAETPEEAARGDIPERYAPTLFVDIDPTGGFATVLLDTNAAGDPYPYEEFCEKGRDGLWYAQGGSNGNTVFTDPSGRFSLLTQWEEAPSGATFARIRFQGRTYECPVKRGYYRLVVWGFDEDRMNREGPNVEPGTPIPELTPDQERRAEINLAGRLESLPDDNALHDRWKRFWALMSEGGPEILEWIYE
jgi:hypothetical protein